MNNDKIENWTKFAFNKMRKEKAMMPIILKEDLEMQEIKTSGVIEEELSQRIEQRFTSEHKVIVSRIKESCES